MKYNRIIIRELGLVFLGLLTGLGLMFLKNNLHFLTTNNLFSVQTRDDEILIRLRGKAIVRLKDQVTHYKFFATGETTPWKRAIVFGSVNANDLVSVTWQNTSETDTMIWNWNSEDRTIITTKRPESLQYGDVFVDQGFVSGASLRNDTRY